MTRLVINFALLHVFSNILQDVQSQITFSLESSRFPSQFDTSNLICISNQFSTSTTDSLNYLNSHFGLSVQLLRAAGRSWIFIGDPKANSTDPTYSAARVTEPGVVWRCSLGYGSEESCQIMHLDPIPSRQECNANSCEDFPHKEYRESSWVGGIIEAKNERFVTCGHRRTLGHSNDPDIMGLCYWFDKESMYQPWHPSTNALNIDLKKYSHRLFPLFEHPNYAPNRYFRLRSLGSNLLVDWTFGQTGISVHLNDDNELLLGAPGVRLWTGSVIIYRDGAKEISMPRLNRNQRPEFGQFSVLKRENHGREGVHYYEYFGYAVTSGRYYNGKGKFYAAGSPKASYRNRYLAGEVVIFSLPPQVKTFNAEAPIKEIETLWGDKLGGYFGSVLLSDDISNDELDELFVGAPFHNQDVNSRGKRDDNSDSSFNLYSRLGDHGVVFIYTSSGTNSLKKYMITGSNVPGSRFGSAICSLGDINEDNFNDFAVSAPFEDDGHGVVYIFYGRSDLSNLRWVERIVAKDYNHLFPSGNVLRGFGSSLSIGRDIDENGTPDLSIGSFLSQQVLILRTRPTIKIQGRLRVLGANKVAIQTVPLNVTTLTIESCVTFTGKHAMDTLRMQVRVAMDDRFTLINSARNDGAASSSVFYADDMRKSQAQCQTLTATASKALKNADDDEQAQIPPIKIQQSITYPGIPKSEKFYHYKIVRGHRGSPTLDTTIGGAIDLAEFCPKCPFAVPTQERVLELQIASICADPTNCKPSIDLQSWFSVDGETVTSTILDWGKRVSLHINATNLGEPAFKPQLSIKWTLSKNGGSLPRHLQFPDDFQISCLHNLDKTNCGLGKPLKKDTHGKQFQIDFDLSGIYATMEQHELQAELNFFTGNSDEGSLAKAKNLLVLDTKFKLNVEGQLFERIGYEHEFTHLYNVNLDGPSIPYEVKLSFKFPTRHQIDGVEQEVLLVSSPAGYNCSVEPGTGSFSELITFVKDGPNFNMSAYNESTVQLSRQRRGTEDAKVNYDDNEGEIDSGKSTALSLESTNKENITELTCDESHSSNSKCMIVHCVISKPAVSIPISFEMALVANVSQRLEKTEKSILVRSFATAKLFNGKSQQSTSEVRLIQPASASRNEVGETPLWIYIVSGIGGLVILAILSAILYRSGFFRREKKEELEQLKVQAGIQDHLLAANQRVPSFQETIEDD